MRIIKKQFPKGSVTSRYDVIVPHFFKNYFTSVVTAYYYSAIKPKIALIKNVDQFHLDLLKNYMASESKDSQIEGILKRIVDNHIYEPDKNKHVVMFTSGKDSLHLLLRLIGEYGEENVLALYCKSINKSEAYYEVRSAEEICKKLGVKFKAIDISNSIKLNRENHNIGLRDQLTLCLSMPYIMDFKAHKVWYGITRGFVDLLSGVFSHHKTAFEFSQKYLESIGINIEISNHIDYPEVNEDKITKDLIENHRELLFMTSSCYAQLNWREKMHKNLQERVHNLEIYPGCGYCVKCCRVNMALLNYDNKNVEDVTARQVLFKHIYKLYKEKFSDDKTLTDQINLYSNILKSESLDVVSES